MLEAIHAHVDDPLAWAAYRDWLKEQGRTWEQPTLTNSIGMKLALLEAGTFLMGSQPQETSHYADERPQHEVQIDRPFYLGVFQVTQEEYQQVMGHNPSYFCAGGAGKKKVKGLDTASFPVEMVSWEEAVEFCKKLSVLPAECEAGRVYRLPSEAEWEYACRAGTTTPYYTGSGEKALTHTGWYANNSGCKIHPVGQKDPNTWGLFDMHGNVWEWCEDQYEYWRELYYHFRRVLRGGSWCSDGWCCRSSYRRGEETDYRNRVIGFRVVLATTE